MSVVSGDDDSQRTAHAATGEWTGAREAPAEYLVVRDSGIQIANLKSYAEYKASLQAWLGDVPNHWPLVPNRALFAEVKDRDHPNEEMLSITIAKGVVRQKALLDGSSKKDSSNRDKSAYKLVQPRDIAYNKMRAWQGSIGASAMRGIISPAYVVMRLRNGDDSPSYFHHLYRTPLFSKEAERWSYGITSDMWSLRPEHFKMIYSPAPPPEEQAAMVKFIDWANKKLEQAVRVKRRVIALLNEQKQAIIHRAVTRGLDSSVPLKPSGIPWLGDIPEHWELWRIGRFARVGNGSTPSRAKPSYWSGGSYPWLNSSQVNRGHIDSADQFVTQLALRECHLPRVPVGSVVVAITGQGKTRGMSAVMGIEATINQHIAFITPRIPVASVNYVHLVLTSAYFPLRAASDDSGSTKGAITCEALKRFKLPIPPRSEQDELLRRVEGETRQIDVAASRLKREIELLCEYQTRLVADIVTGKLDVREAAARLPEADVNHLTKDPLSSLDDAEFDDNEAEIEDLEL